ncbi:MAG: hypothetical protein NC117_10365 [Pseudoflavonifractor sp.]|nr:hypothetical protein [Pseudoflavonifractor sp.]
MNRFLIITSIAMTAATTARAQWSDNPLTAFPTGTRIYDVATAVAPDGSTWMYVEEPTGYADDETKITCDFRVQRFDPQGNRCFGDNGKLLAASENLSYSLTAQRLFVDAEGNALIIVTDTRDAGKGSYSLTNTAYKVSADGTMLWDDEGVTLGIPGASETSGCFSIVQLPDSGDYVIAWFESTDTGGHILINRFSRETGAPLWSGESQTVLEGDGGLAQYPYLVTSGAEGHVMMLYADGTNQNLTVRKVNADGDRVWTSDKVIYDKGWNRTPLWTLLDVKPSGDGGMIVGWHDNHANISIMRGYMAYVAADGSTPFAATTGGEAAVCLSAEGMDGFNVKVMPAPDAAGGFMALWRETDVDTQSYQQLKMQRLKSDGTQEWTAGGKALNDLESITYSSPFLMPRDSRSVAVFYQVTGNLGTNSRIVASAFDTLSGDAVPGTDALPMQATLLSALTKPLTLTSVGYNEAQSCWIASMVMNSGNDDESEYLLQRLNSDFSFCRSTGIDHIDRDGSASQPYDRYYNLQGLPVTTPTAGHLYIKLTPTGPQKLIYR